MPGLLVRSWEEAKNGDVLGGGRRLVVTLAARCGWSDAFLLLRALCGDEMGSVLNTLSTAPGSLRFNGSRGGGDEDIGRNCRRRHHIAVVTVVSPELESGIHRVLA